MMMIVSTLVFGGALSLSAYAMFATMRPELGRMTDALFGRSRPRFEPLATLVRAERRIAVRRWSAASPHPAARWREAA